jgi:hypothetical protein
VIREGWICNFSAAKAEFGKKRKGLELTIFMTRVPQLVGRASILAGSTFTWKKV